MQPPDEDSRGGWAHWTDPNAVYESEAVHTKVKSKGKGKAKKASASVRKGERENNDISNISGGAWDGYLMGDFDDAGMDLSGRGGFIPDHPPLPRGRGAGTGKTKTSSGSLPMPVPVARQIFRVGDEDDRAIEADRSRMLSAMLAGLGFGA
jgi:hypothetical protein